MKINLSNLLTNNSLLLTPLTGALTPFCWEVNTTFSPHLVCNSSYYLHGFDCVMASLSFSFLICEEIIICILCCLEDSTN